MNKDQKITGLAELVDQIGESVEDTDTVSLETILEIIGRRSFGALLLMAGIITLAPIIGDIPGVPTIMGLVVFLTAIQLLLNRQNLWLPQFLLKRSIQGEKLRKALDKSLTPAKYIDRLLKPRLTLFTKGIMTYIIALICLGIAVTIPVLEFIPFSANLAGIALTAFGLALIARDGLLAIVALASTASIVVLIVYQLI